MKSSIKKSTYKAIYRLLDRVSPVSFDCGTLCSSRCCTYGDLEDDDFGIYLLPGEEKVFNGDEEWLRWTCEDALFYDFPDSWFGDLYFVRCKTPPNCPREMRPLQCRFFPLTPHMTEDGCLMLILHDESLPYSCPLTEEPDKYPLEPDFIKATYTVWTHLMRDRLIYDLVVFDSNIRIKSGTAIKTVYPY